MGGWQRIDLVPLTASRDFGEDEKVTAMRGANTQTPPSTDLTLAAGFRFLQQLPSSPCRFVLTGFPAVTQDAYSAMRPPCRKGIAARLPRPDFHPLSSTAFCFGLSQLVAEALKHSSCAHSSHKGTPSLTLCEADALERKGKQRECVRAAFVSVCERPTLRILSQRTARDGRRTPGSRVRAARHPRGPLLTSLSLLHLTRSLARCQTGSYAVLLGAWTA